MGFLCSKARKNRGFEGKNPPKQGFLPQKARLRRMVFYRVSPMLAGFLTQKARENRQTGRIFFMDNKLINFSREKARACELFEAKCPKFTSRRDKNTQKKCGVFSPAQMPYFPAHFSGFLRQNARETGFLRQNARVYSGFCFWGWPQCFCRGSIPTN